MGLVRNLGRRRLDRVEQLEQAGQGQIGLVDLQQIGALQVAARADEEGARAAGPGRLAVARIGQEAELVRLGPVQRRDAPDQTLGIAAKPALDLPGQFTEPVCQR